MYKNQNIKLSLSLSGVIISLFLTLLLVNLEARAHSLWVETPSVINTGEKTAFEIYFGEYHEELREISGGRLDERKGVTAYIHDPSGVVTNLPVKKNKNHFSVLAKLTDSGIHFVLAEDLKSSVVDLTKYGKGLVRPFYYARRPFLSFAKGNISDRQVNLNSPVPELRLDIMPLTRHVDVRSGTLGPHLKQEMVFQVFFNGQMLTERAKVSIFSPNGWLWEGRLDSKGVGRFTPLWSGLYVVTVSLRTDIPGEFQGIQYEAESHTATLSIYVPPKEKQSGK